MRTLDQLRPGQTATIARVTAEGLLAEGLSEAGFAEGGEVEVLARGLFGGSPLSVRLGRAVVALRRGEAAAITLT